MGMSKTRVPTTDAEFDLYINTSTDYLLSDNSSDEMMAFEDGEEMLFEDGEEMEYEG